MNRLVAIAVATALLALPTHAIAQTGDPFGPVGPSAPPPEPEPAPAPALEEDDGELGAAESLGLAAVALAIIAAVFVAITREGRRMDLRARRAHRQRKGRRSARPADLHRGRAAGAPAGGPRAKRRTSGEPAAAPGADRGAQAKPPPPPPRKRRAKAKRR